jgi:hypothetical protein
LINFLTGPGFAAVTRTFGWPRVRTWVVGHAGLAGGLAEAQFASREIETIAPYSDLSARRADAKAETSGAVRNGALAAITGFDAANWTMVRFRLWREWPADVAAPAQLYAVGHISLPQQR